MGLTLAYLERNTTMDAISLLGTTLGIGFAAGLRLYATVLGLGLALRMGWLVLPEAMRPLEVLQHPAVLIAAGAAYVLELVNDKIPWVDSLWDAVHTFIRPVGAALLAATAFGELDPVPRTVLVLLTGGVALSSHASKAATRLAVNQSPEPFSNLGLSLLGDIAAPVGVWFAFTHPIATLCLVLVFLAVFLWLASWIFRMLRGGLAKLREGRHPAA
jgi:hypothetical protein